MRSNRTLLFLLLIGCILFVGAGFLTGVPNSQVIAIEPTPSDDEVNSIASELFCPVCENIPLDVCDSEACRQWRQLIREMLAQGKTNEEIKKYFSEYYGVRVLAEPPRSGFYLIAYVIPFIAILFGIIVLIKSMRKWRFIGKINNDEIEKNKFPPDKYVANFEEEFKRFK